MIQPAIYQNPHHIVGSYSGSPLSVQNPPNFEQTSRFLSSNKTIIPVGACIGTVCNTGRLLQGGNRKKRRKTKKNRKRKYTNKKRIRYAKRTKQLRGGYSLAAIKLTANNSMLANPPPITT